MHKVELESKNFEITESIKKHVKKSFSKLKEQFDSTVSNNIRVYLKTNNHHSHLKNVKIVIPTKHSEIIINECSEDLYKAIKQASTKAIRALRKKKEKYQ